MDLFTFHYCHVYFFSEATYRYSLLRGMEAQVISEDLEDENQDECQDREESDEVTKLLLLLLLLYRGVITF